MARPRRLCRATQHLPGDLLCFDQSDHMLHVARGRLPGALGWVRGDALRLPFASGSFNRVVTAHFYGHLDRAARESFLREARRIASELIVIDSAFRDGVQPEEWQERTLNDGSRWKVYKRYLSASTLIDELGGGEPLFEGRWFTVVRSASQRITNH